MDGCYGAPLSAPPSSCQHVITHEPLTHAWPHLPPVTACLMPASPDMRLPPAMQLGELAERTQQLAMIVNPQWELKGNLVSDFGLGGTRQRREALAASFVDSYYLKQLRVYGDEVRVLRAYPGKFQVSYAGVCVWQCGMQHLRLHCCWAFSAGGCWACSTGERWALSTCRGGPAAPDG